MKKLFYLLLLILPFLFVSCFNNEAKKQEDRELQEIFDELSCGDSYFTSKNDYPYLFKKLKNRNTAVWINGLEYMVRKFDEIIILSEVDKSNGYIELRQIDPSQRLLLEQYDMEIKRFCGQYYPKKEFGNYIITLMDYPVIDPNQSRVYVSIESKDKSAFVYTALPINAHSVLPEGLVFIEPNLNQCRIYTHIHINWRFQFYKYVEDGKKIKFDQKTLTIGEMFDLN